MEEDIRNNMKIASVTAVYNNEEVVGTKLESLSIFEKNIVVLGERKLDDIEGLLAPDRTEKIIKYYFPNVTLIKGDYRTLAEQLNAGIEYAVGYDYIFTIDADAIFIDKDMEKIVDFCNSNHGFDFYGYPTNMVVDFYYDLYSGRPRISELKVTGP